MKQFLLLPLFLLCLITCVFAQSGSFKIVPQQYSTSTGSPLLFTRGDTLKIESDTVYLMLRTLSGIVFTGTFIGPPWLEKIQYVQNC